MPTTGPMKLDSGRVVHPGEGWRSAYQHANEGFIAKFGVHEAEAQQSCEGEGKVRQR
jgi:hypothetical protein